MRPWRNGGGLAFDTSVLHETGNDSDEDRLVLLLRFWHPEVTSAEREALQLIFTCLDVADLGVPALKEFERMVLSDTYTPQEQISAGELSEYLQLATQKEPADSKRRR
jgi:hypothetical protein